MSTDTKIKTLIFNKLTQEQYNNADRVPTEFYLTPDDTDEKLATKQDKLIAGTNITIDGNVISATGGSGSGFDFEGTKAEFDAAVAAGTITDDSVSLITDDVSGDNIATKAELQAVDRSKADTSLSNVLANIDYVVESKTPTADDPTWYRKYKSGWLEQGGLAKSNADVTVTLLKPFADTNYSVQCTNRRLGTDDGWGWIFVLNMTTTSFMARACYGGGTTTDIRAMWEAKGMGAN